MNRNTTFYSIILFLLFSFSKSNAQVEVRTKNALEKMKDGNTHLIVNDLNFPRSVEYNRVFKKYWTFTKGIDFIKKEDLDGSLVAGDTYVSFEMWESRTSTGISVGFLFLNIWMPSEGEVKRQKYNVFLSHPLSMASIYLTQNTETMVKYIKENKSGDKKKVYEGPYQLYDFDGDGFLLNWSPGIMKNYIQSLASQLQTGKKYDIGDEITKKDQLPLLSGQTLYFTTDILNKMGLFAGVNKIRTDADKAEDIKDIFKDYQYSYKLITNSELEDKILEDKEPFYYLVFLNSSRVGKFLAVVNSRTGEVIYSLHKSMSVDLNKSDIKDLNKAIK